MGKLIHICLGVAMTSAALAQSAANFNTGSLAPAGAAPKADPSVKPKPKEEGPTTTTPSRFVGPAELDAYVQSLTSVLSIGNRTTDPFGQPQDPAAKPIIKNPVVKSTQRTPQLQATPFSEIVRLLVVNTIMPGERRFLVGTRSISQGDHIPFTYRGRQIRVEVMEVNSRQILFRNVDTNETASIRMKLLPEGMTPGHNGITAPGMVPDRPNAPIELEPNEPTVENSQNR